MDMINLTLEEYADLVKGDYTLRPCGECELGVIYVDGALGEEISLRYYKELQEDDNYRHNLYEVSCDTCHGVGRIVNFD